MECAGIKELLSEYIDGALDLETRGVVDQHLSECATCRQDLASMRALVDELGSLEPVQPPEDFLDQLHERMAPRFSFRRMVKALFVPAQIKIPLELATALTAAIIIFSALNIQYWRPKVVALREPADVEMAKEQSAVMDGPIEVALLLRERGPLLDETAVARQGAAPAGKTKQEGVVAPAAPVAGEGKRFSSRAKNAKEPTQPSDSELVFHRIRSLIALAEGRVVSREQDAAKGPSTVIVAEIPSKNYTMFVNGLASMGTLASPAPPLPQGKGNMIPIRIRILPPKDQG